MITQNVYVPIDDLNKAMDKLYEFLPEELHDVCEWFEIIFKLFI